MFSLFLKNYNIYTNRSLKETKDISFDKELLVSLKHTQAKKLIAN